MIDNLRPLWIAVCVLNWLRWRLLGLPGRKGRGYASIPRIREHVRLIRPRQVRLGDYVVLHPGCCLRAGPQGELIVGACSSVGEFSILNAIGRVEIGAGVMIAPGCHVTDANHVVDGTGPIQLRGRRIEPVVIEDGAWIAAGARILPGVRIGCGSVVAAGAVVTQDVPPGVIVGGVPARQLRARSPVGD